MFLMKKKPDAETVAMIAEGSLCICDLPANVRKNLSAENVAELSLAREVSAIEPDSLSAVEMSQVMSIIGNEKTATHIISLSLKKITEPLTLDTGWSCGSPMFAMRDAATADRISFVGSSGKQRVHMELARTADDAAELRIGLGNSSGQPAGIDFDAELVCEGKFSESVSSRRGSCAVFPALPPGNYLLRIKDKSKCIDSLELNIRQ